jgi:hypothetical protein
VPHTTDEAALEFRPLLERARQIIREPIVDGRLVVFTLRAATPLRTSEETFAAALNTALLTLDFTTTVIQNPGYAVVMFARKTEA